MFFEQRFEVALFEKTPLQLGRDDRVGRGRNGDRNCGFLDALADRRDARGVGT